MLARREYSRQELFTKLASRDYAEQEIDVALERLVSEGLQSDERFATEFVQSRVDRGNGPVKIRCELQQRGVAESIIDDALRLAGIDWVVLALAVYRKKYGDSPADYRDRARRMRFLQQRGFEADDCRRVLEKVK